MTPQPMTLAEAWAHVSRVVEGQEQDGESTFNGEDLGALQALDPVVARAIERRSGMMLTAEEVQVAYGLAVQVRRASEARNSAVRPLSDREDRLLRDMSLMLGSTADGERR